VNYTFAPCEFDDYLEAVNFGSLDSEVDPDVRAAKLALELVQEQFLPRIIKAQHEAVSVLLQVLYLLQQGHVQFLMGDYKARVLEAHGFDALTTKTRAKKLGKDGLPRLQITSQSTGGDS
jgi:hypothetical protein